ncbi:MAG TPA: lipoyl(octanoyl) transferase LipB [Solirubrobacterales bacterium]|nr:lipoyl(octanoyl) transferase LipB [Solirubrobacterales bacterium]
MSSEILVVHCGLVPYEEGLRLQHEVEARRQADEIADVLLLLEHPPVYTKGRRVTPAELPMGEEWYEAQGIEVLDTDRGGHVTYHGPGQLVAYPIVSLAAYGGDVHEYVRGLERVMIAALAKHGVQAGTVPGETGVWVGDLKIGAIGLHVSRGVTTHGFAVNVCNDLQPFGWVLACQIEGGRVTSLSRELGAEQSVADFSASVLASYGEEFERTPRTVDPAEVGLSIATATLPGAS